VKDDLRKYYQNCVLCPRACGVNRQAGRRGFCGETAELRVAAAVLHRGEEPPLCGSGGSGTVFISGCNLGCVFCQNWQISQGGLSAGRGAVNTGGVLGRAVSAEEFASICLALQEKGAENINIVTGSHAVPAIVEGLTAARKAGLSIPALWNSSAYESPEALELLRDHINMYLPDLKTLDSTLAARFFNAPAYPKAAAAAILKMMEMTRTRPGVIIRHLVLPGFLEATRQVLRWFADNALRQGALLSLMTQYTPLKGSGAQAPDRFLSEAEYETVLYWLEEFGIEDGFCQEPVTAPRERDSGWLPDFNRFNPFPPELSVPVWHWKSST
jgi:putative pyruvate formate lyase activating enzyme